MAAKKQAPPAKAGNRSSSKSQGKGKARSKTKRPSADAKTRNQKKVSKSVDEEASESSEAEEVEKGRSAGDDKEGRRGKKKGKKEDVKKRRREEEDDDDEDAEERGEVENALYRFPMNRVSRIIKSENPDPKIAQEAVFVINRATEKFLHLFCTEAYAHAFLDKKNFIAYNHLSSVVSKRERFKFLSDFVPEQVKVEDALAQVAKAEKQTGSNLDS